MKGLSLVICVMAMAVFTVTTIAPSEARADGCYICTSGSADACKDYCKYVGDDTFDNRHACEAKGCKIGGTASCPTAANYKVCQLLENVPVISDALAFLNLLTNSSLCM